MSTQNDAAEQWEYAAGRHYSQQMENPVECPACGDQGEYWEDRVPVHDSIVGFEIREAGIRHPDGRLCTEW
jgi:hypothetical protein